MTAFLLLLAIGAPAAKPTAARVPVTAQTRQMTLAGRWDEAVRLLEKEIASADRRRRRESAAELRAELGRVVMDRNFFHRHNPDAARAALERALLSVRNFGDSKAQADLTQSIGQLHYSEAFATKEWVKPRAFFDKAIKLREALRDRRGLAESYFYLGLTHEQAGEPEPALRNYRTALFLAQEAEDKVLESYAHRHIGGIHEERGELDAAERSIRRSLELRRQAGFTVAVPFALIQLADFAERRRNDPDQAVRHLEEAVEAAKESRSTRALYAARLELARLSLARKDSRAALTHAEAALVAAREFGDPEGVKTAEKRLDEVRAPVTPTP